MEQIAGIILKYRILFFILIGLLTGFFGYFARQASTDNSIEVWLNEGDPKLDYYHDFIEKFGDEEFLIIAVNDASIFSSEGIKLVDSIAKELEKLEGVKNVTSLASVFKDKLSSPYFKDILKKSRGKKVVDVFKEEIMSDHMYLNNVISGDGKTTAIIATVEKSSPESRMKLVNESRGIITSTRNALGQEALPKDFYLAGPSIVNAELDRMSQRDIRVFMPIMFAVAFVILVILFRNFSGVLIPILTISINTIWAVGLFVIFHNKMNMVSSMLTPLVFIISLATTVHILNRFYQEVTISKDRQRNVLETVKSIGIPCFLTCTTTSIGFLSLMVSDVTPVKNTGIFIAAGIMMSFFVCITLVPGILSLFPVLGSRTSGNVSEDEKLGDEKPGDEKPGNAEVSGMSGFVGSFVKKNTLWIFVFSIIFVGFAIYGITRIKVESNIFESFPENSEISRSTAYIENNLMGLLPIEIAINAVDTGGIFQPEVLDKMETLQDYLKELPEVTTSMSVADYVRKLNKLLGKDKSNNQAVTQQKAIDYVKLASLHGDSIVKSLYTSDNNEGRVSVRMKNVGSSRYQEIVSGIEQFIKSNVPVSIGCTITGIVPLLMDMQGYLVESQIKTFTLAFILIFICITLLLKSLRIGMISMIPNLIPITVTLGVMGYLDIRLDVATIMIASVAIGISVDDTIHFLYRFKKEFRIDMNHYLAIKRTLSGVGRALVFTTVVATCGFLIFCLSSFKPIQYFGLLTGVTMVTALVADIFILPSCILLFKPKFA
ncbi:MAG: efflux RND transporter permease subunit [Planctomycetota bacterium]|jgi:predicted RND superfamily exporter protein